MSHLKDRSFTSRGGFTLLEMLVALAILGFSLCLLLDFIANSLRLAGKAELASRKLLLAQSKADEALLGLLEDTSTTKGKERVWQGLVARDIAWKVKEYEFSGDKTDARESTSPPTLFYDVSVGGLEVSSARLQKKALKTPPRE